MEVTPQIQADFTNQMLTEFAVGLDQVLQARLQEITGKVPHETIQLMRYEIMEANASDISARYSLYFQDSGRISEMKNLKGGRMVPVDQILAWIRRGRAGLFKKKGSRGSGGAIANAREQEAIAFAIARSKKKAVKRRGKKLKDRQWINRNFYSWYERLVSDFITRQPEILKQLIEHTIDPLKNIEF